MPEWLLWVIGGVGVIFGLYLLVSLIIFMVVGTIFNKVCDKFWDIFDG